jgi:hypothetical protein
MAEPVVFRASDEAFKRTYSAIPKAGRRRRKPSQRKGRRQ